jgi:hypothetical protein
MRALLKKLNDSSIIPIVIASVMLIVLPTTQVFAQGSIFGSVTNSDLTTPDTGTISFIGYLDDTDEEIHIETSTGAGYDSIFWYDDFQNYLTEAPGNPYDYHFYNMANNEGAILSELIPISSFHQEDIQLAPVQWPEMPTGLAGWRVSDSSVVVGWNATSDVTHHVYRRTGPSYGSLFRIDDPSGLLTNPGVSDNFFVDTTVNGLSSYHYLILPEDSLGNLGPHSSFIIVDSGVVDAPVITAIIPDTGFTSGGTPVTITGTGFDMAGVTVTIDGAALTSLIVISPYEISGLLPIGDPGPADVIVTNTASGLSSNPLVDGFTYIPDNSPVLTDIPDQTIAEGETFDDISLDDYVIDPDHADDEIIWSHTGSVELLVNINVNRIAGIQVPDAEWSGSETIIFRATDPDSLFREDSAVFTVRTVNDPPAVAAIPDQAIIGSGAFGIINLDDFVNDPDHHDSTIDWSYSGDSELSVDITDRVAVVTISSPDWSGSETIIFRATDPGSEYDEDSVNFVQVKVETPVLELGNVLADHPDSAKFTISTPADFTVTFPSIVLQSDKAEIHREDGGAIDDDIPPGTDMDYWFVWTPSGIGQLPGTVTITSSSLDDSEVLEFNGHAVDFYLDPAISSHDFGNVNSVDARAAGIVIFSAEIRGNIGAIITGLSPNGSSNDFALEYPSMGDSLPAGREVSFKILSHPQNTGPISADAWIVYSIDLDDNVATDSINFMTLIANGVEPGCAVVQDTVDFYGREVGSIQTLPFTLSNNSTVLEVIDSINFDAYNDVYWVDPGIMGWPLIIPPGDTDITIYFNPSNETSYETNMIIVDSLASGDCDPPVVKGVGVPVKMHWNPDTPLSLGLIELCESATAYNYTISNEIIGFGMVVNDIIVDSSDWFVFDPDISTVIGTTYSPTDNIEFDSIVFAPRNIQSPMSFNMMLIYNVDTTGAPPDTLDFSLAGQTGGCAGRLNQPPPLLFISSVVGNSVFDTISLNNNGACQLVVDSFVLDHGNFLLPEAVTPLVIPSGTQYLLTVQFTPTEFGSVEAQLTVYHDGFVAPIDPAVDCPINNQTVVNLAGVGADISPPSINNIVTGDCGRTLDIYVSDIGLGVESVTSKLRKGNAAAGYTSTSNSPVPIAAGQWQLQISDSDLPADSINIFGYEIEVVATDSSANADTLRRSVAGCWPGDIDGMGIISAEKWLGGDGRDTLWHLVSFPGSLPTYEVDRIFGQFSHLPPSLNGEDDAWRLYEFRDNAFRILTTQPEAEIEPGRGYWFRHFGQLDTLRLDPSGAATAMPTLIPFEVSLQHGWNLIGNPYLFPVSINDTLIDTDSISSFVRQIVPASSGGRNWWQIFDLDNPLPQLQPWQGYAVWCENPAGYSIYLDPHYEPDAGPMASGEGWVVTVNLAASGQSSGTIQLGTHPDGSDGPDITDVRSVTFFNKPAGLNLKSEMHGLFMRDIRPPGDLQIWRLDISDNSNRQLTLSWSFPSPPEPGMVIWLYDAVIESVTDMSAHSNYVITNPARMPAGRFSILLGDYEAVKAGLDAESPAQPTTYQLYQNYPNPFNPHTRILYDLPQSGQVSIDIFNVLGQRVAQLVNEYQEAGFHEISWDGSANDGHRLASGIYFARMSVGSFTSTIKMSLLK